MNPYKSAVAALLLTVMVAAPSAAQQASFTAETPPSEALCTARFAYLEFPPPSEAEAAASKSMPLVTAQDGQVAEIAARTSAASREYPGTWPLKPLTDAERVSSGRAGWPSPIDF